MTPKNHNYKVFAVNATDWFNKGDTTNRIGLACALRKQLGNSLRLTIESATYDKDRKYFSKFDVNVVKSLYSYKHGDELWKLAIQFIWSSIVLLNYAIIFRILKAKPARNRMESIYFREILDSDLVLSSPGGFIHDELLITVLLPSLIQLVIPLILKKRIIIYAQSIGPLQRKISKLLVRQVFLRIETIILRETMSLKSLRELGIPHSRIFVAADATFSLCGDMLATASRRAANLRKQRARPLIGITVLNRYWGSNESRNKYIHVMGELANFLVDRFAADIIFIPQRLSWNAIWMTKEIRSLVRNKKCVKIDFADYTPEDLLSLVGSVDMLIGTRMHSNILALLMNVPVVAIAYQPKTLGIMHMMGLEEWVLQIEHMNLQDLTTKVEQLWKRREATKDYISLQVRSMRQQSEKSAEIVKSTLETPPLEITT